MLRIRDVFWIIGGNLGKLIARFVIAVFYKLRLGLILSKIWGLLTIPYCLFRKHSEDGSISFSKHAHGQNAAGAALLDLLFLPYNLYLESTEFLGESEHDREALRFWFTIAWISVPLLLWFLVWVSGYGQPEPPQQ